MMQFIEQGDKKDDKKRRYFRADNKIDWQKCKISLSWRPERIKEIKGVTLNPWGD